jgi:mannan endo-1,4-beta-mannosidase
VDGDLNTYWRTKQNSKLAAEWITVDLGSSVMIRQVILRWNSNYATSYNIQLSPDNTTWTTVFSTTSGDGSTDTISFGATAARYVRMYSTAWRNNGARNWLNEFQIYP